MIAIPPALSEKLRQYGMTTCLFGDAPNQYETFYFIYGSAELKEHAEEFTEAADAYCDAISFDYTKIAGTPENYQMRLTLRKFESALHSLGEVHELLMQSKLPFSLVLQRAGVNRYLMSVIGTSGDIVSELDEYVNLVNGISNFAVLDQGVKISEEDLDPILLIIFEEVSE